MKNYVVKAENEAEQAEIMERIKHFGLDENLVIKHKLIVPHTMCPTDANCVVKNGDHTFCMIVSLMPVPSSSISISRMPRSSVGCVLTTTDFAPASTAFCKIFPSARTSCVLSAMT